MINKFKKILAMQFIFFVLVYIFAYYLSVLAFAISPFAIVCSVAALYIAYAGVGIMKQYFTVGFSGDEKELEKFISQSAPTVGGKRLDVKKTPLSEWTTTYVVVGLVLFLFDALLFVTIEIVGPLMASMSLGNLYSGPVMVSGPLDFYSAKQNLNLAFLLFTIVGIVIGLTPIGKKLSPFFKKLEKKQEKIREWQSKGGY